MNDLIHFLTNLFWNLNYISIFLLMALESSIFPVPSEAVMIPAWYLAKEWILNIYIVIIAWAFWSLFWAIANYYILGQFIWKPFLLKYWKYFLISEKKYHKSEKLFLKNDKLYTFIWRLLPVIRHLISIPAWIFKMNFIYFSLITTLWAWIWCAILSLFWYFFWKGIVDVFHKYTHEVSLWVVVFFVIWFIYFIRKKD